MAVSKRQSEQEHQQGTVLFNSQVQAVSRNSRAPLVSQAELRRAESVAEAGADPTVAACAIQSAPRSACYEALPLTL
jgi:hypothetical protein